MMCLPDRVGRLKSRLDNVEDVHIRDLYAGQSSHESMLRSLDDRYAEHEARLIHLQTMISKTQTAHAFSMSHRGPGSEPYRMHTLLRENYALGELEAKPTSIEMPASQADGGAASVVLAVHDAEGGALDLEGGVQQDEPPGGGAIQLSPTASPRAPKTESANEEKNRMGNIVQYASPLAHGVLDTIAQLDTEMRKLGMNMANHSSYLNKVDADLQQCIPATNYATRNVDSILIKLKDMEDSIALLSTKAHGTEKRLNYAMDHLATFEVMDDTKPPPTPTQPVRAMLESSSPPQHHPGET